MNLLSMGEIINAHSQNIVIGVSGAVIGVTQCGELYQSVELEPGWG
jgi:hypothetical protein